MVPYVHRCDPTVRNFGDFLNFWLWPKMMELSDDGILLGIGSVLSMVDPPPQIRVVVCGAGAGYHLPPTVSWGRWFPYWYPEAWEKSGHVYPLQIPNHWDVRAVRGPMTAKAIDREDVPQFDPAIYCSTLYQPDVECTQQIKYMPHHLSHWVCDWRKVVEPLGWGFISPLDPIERVLDEIASAGQLVTDCLHGAVCADCYRVPWTPVRVYGWLLPWKWSDWLQGMQMSYSPAEVHPQWDARMAAMYFDCQDSKNWPEAKMRARMEEDNAMRSCTLEGLEDAACTTYLSERKVFEECRDTMEATVKAMLEVY